LPGLTQIKRTSSNLKGKRTLLVEERQFIRIDVIKQTHDSLMANWIAMFDYSKAHQSKRLSLSNTSKWLPLFENALQTLEH